MTPFDTTEQTWEPYVAAQEAVEQAAYERRRPLAVQRVTERLAGERDEMTAFYTGRVVVEGGAPLTAEEASTHVTGIYSPESENFLARVIEEMAAMESDYTLSPPMQPVPPFEITDWTGTDVEVDERGLAWTLTKSGRRVRADDRIERRIDPAIDEVEKKHGLHDKHVHPWCPRCDVREGRTVYTGQDVKNAGRTDDALLADGRQKIEARVRYWLNANGGVPPTHPLTLEVPDARPDWYALDGLVGMPQPAWLIDGLIPQSGIGYIIGRDGVKKTFLALDMALSVACGMGEFHGRAIHEEAYSGVLFVAGEGVSSFGARCQAWAAARGHEFDDDDRASFAARAGAVNLYKGGDAYEAMLARVKHQQPDLVVFDTLQRCAQGADQNSAADMAVVTARLDEVKHASGGVVIVIAHTDKGDNDARGSSSIEDDADFVIHLKDRDGVVEARVTKQKDGESGSTLRLAPEAHAGSIALVAADEARVGEALAGNSVRLRIINALRLAHGEHLTVKEVHSATTTREAPATEGHVGNLLREMADKGEVQRAQSGERRKATYWLDPVLDGTESPEA